MNKGLSEVLLKNFSHVLPTVRPSIELSYNLDPFWLAGFTTAEGCFYVKITKSSAKIGFQVQLVFLITQHIRDEHLIKRLIKYFECGYIKRVKTRPNVVYFTVTKFDDITNKIIPFFKKYKIQGTKFEDFKDWCLVAELIISKKHLTRDGLDQILKIKNGMNTNRK